MQPLFFTGGYDDSILRWDVSAANLLQRTTFEFTMNRMVISPDATYLAVASNPHVKIYDVKTRMVAPTKSYEAHKGNVTGIGISREGQYIYTSSEDGTAKIWEPQTCSTYRDCSFGSPCNCIILHPNQAELIVGTQDGRICVWNAKTNSITQTVVPDKGESIQSIDVTYDGMEIALVTTKGKCFIYTTNMKNGMIGELKMYKEFEAHQNFVTCCKYSPNTVYLATSSADNTIKLWKRKPSYQHEKTLQGHTGWVWDVCFSNNNEYLISASTDGSARLWQIKIGEEIQKYSQNDKGLVCLALFDKPTL